MSYKSSSIVRFQSGNSTVLGSVVTIERLCKDRTNVRVFCKKGLLIISEKEIKEVVRY